MSFRANLAGEELAAALEQRFHPLHRVDKRRQCLGHEFIGQIGEEVNDGIDRVRFGWMRARSIRTRRISSMSSFGSGMTD